MNTPFVKYLRIRDLRIKLGGRSRSSIYRDIEQGRLPAPTGKGKRPLWIEDEVDEFLSNHRVGGTQP